MIRAPIQEFSFGHDEEYDPEDEKRADAIMSVRDDFRYIFTTPQGERALTYLYHFCKQGVSTHSSSDRDSSFQEGMRRVYLQIAGFVQMTDEKIYELAQTQARERSRT